MKERIMKQDYGQNMTIDFSREEVKVKEVKKETEWNLDFAADKEEKKQVRELVTSNYKFVVVDIETTGIKPQESRMTEIVALRYDNGWNKVGVVYHNLLNPSQKIPQKIVDLTKITQEMVKHKPYSGDGVKDFLRGLNATSDILVAHNAVFEYEWFTHANGAFKLMNWICTRGIYLYMRDGNTYQNNYKKDYSRLKQVCEYYGIEYIEKDAHRAEYDVLKTQLVAAKMINKLGLGLCLKISEAYVQGKGYGPRWVQGKRPQGKTISQGESRCAGAPLGPEGKKGPLKNGKMTFEGGPAESYIKIGGGLYD